MKKILQSIDPSFLAAGNAGKRSAVPAAVTSPATKPVSMFKSLSLQSEADTQLLLEKLICRFEKTERDRDTRRHLNMAIEYLDAEARLGNCAKFGAGRGGAVLWLLAAIDSCRQTAGAKGASSLPRIFVFDSFAAADHVRKMFQLFSPWISISDMPLLDNLRFLSGELAFSLVHIEEHKEEQTVTILENLFEHRALQDGCVLLLQDGLSRQSWADLALRYAIKYADLGHYAVSGQAFLINSYRQAAAKPPEISCQILDSFERTTAEKDIRKHLTLAVEYVYAADVEGEIAEFGTCEGRTAAWLANAISSSETYYSPQKQSIHDKRFEAKQLFLFDSFEGLPEAVSEIDKECPHVATGVWGPSTSKFLDAVQLRELCQKFMPGDRIKIIEGWYKDSMKNLPSAIRFGLIHIDCDLYQSTMEALEALFANGLISEGAALLFDDWNPNRASPQFGERKAWSELLEKYAIRYSDWGSYGWGGQKFLIHSYCPRTAALVATSD